VLSLYFLIKIKDRLKDIGTKLNLLEDQQAKDKQSIIETLNSQYTDVMLNLKKLEPETEKEIDDQEYFEKAKNIVISAGKASATLLQRILKIGYARAARLLDMLESAGIVSSAFGSEPREVLENYETEEQVLGDDLLIPDVIDFVAKLKTIRATSLQRKFRIGYARAAGLLDILEEKGILGPANGIKPRKVFKK
jgi:DNA segregation ATPase FtsK/SpoIIIE-like protein